MLPLDRLQEMASGHDLRNRPDAEDAQWYQVLATVYSYDAD
jgi:hypothetical protein